VSEKSSVDAEPLVRSKVTRLLASHPPSQAAERNFLAAQFDSGLAFVHFPANLGGLGIPRKFQAIVSEQLVRFGAPIAEGRNPIGYGMAAPTLATKGSPDQCRRYLRPLFTCEEIWCQLFSEPGAGSDVASLSTQAVRDGDEWVINGQKVWSSLAHLARFGMLLARTDPTAEKHKGLTYFVVDMQSPGVEVRPLRQMTGNAEFSEVYFTDVRIPDAERLGEVGDGWNGAIVTLMNERVFIGNRVTPRGADAISRALDLWKSRPKSDRGPVRRGRLTQLWVESEVTRLTTMRAAENASLGVPGPEGSIIKLASAELNKRIYEFCEDLLGPQGMLSGSWDSEPPVPADESFFQWMFLRSPARSIEGGTSEVMRNILGERILSLPSDVRSDKSVPWSETLRS